MKLQNRVLAILLLSQSFFMFVAVGILSSSIQWPRSLGYEAKALMTIIAQNPDSVQLGYLCYLFSTLIFIPIIVLTQRLDSKNSKVFLSLATIFGLFGTFFKILGISRWLTVQPLLAKQFINAANNDHTIQLFEIINQYFGTLGENFGVMFGIGLWTLFVGFYLLGNQSFNKLLTSAMIFMGLILFLGFFKISGLNLPNVYLMITGAGWQLITILLGLQILKNSFETNKQH